MISAVKVVMDLYSVKYQGLILAQLIECNRICRSIQEEKNKGPK